MKYLYFEFLIEFLNRLAFGEEHAPKLITVSKQIGGELTRRQRHSAGVSSSKAMAGLASRVVMINDLLEMYDNAEAGDAIWD